MTTRVADTYAELPLIGIETKPAKLMHYQAGAACNNWQVTDGLVVDFGWVVLRPTERTACLHTTASKLGVFTATKFMDLTDATWER